MNEKAKVLVSRRIPQKAIDLLAQRFEVEVSEHDRPLTPEELRARLAGKQGLVCLLQDKINQELLAAVPGLKVACNVAVGYDNMDLGAAARHGVMLTNTPEVLTDTTADFAFALLLAAARRVAEADRFARAGRFKEWKIDLLLGQDVHHATLGIFGMGRIGRAMARRALGFDMRLLYHDAARQPPQIERELELQFVPKMQLLQEADFVSLHVPLLPSTHHFIGAAELAAMKRTAVLINTSRGPVIDEQALVDGLKAGSIAGAGLDVFEFEPRVHPEMLHLENVVLAPHIASASVATRERMAMLAAENCIAALTGRVPPNLLNPQVLQRRDGGA